MSSADEGRRKGEKEREGRGGEAEGHQIIRQSVEAKTWLRQLDKKKQKQNPKQNRKAVVASLFALGLSVLWCCNHRRYSVKVNAG